MVAQPAAAMAAGGSSGEEPAPEMTPEPAEQEQAAPSMAEMMALLLQKVGGMLARRGRARKGWRSARRFDGLSRRCLSGLTRAGRHCGVVAAPPDLCAGACSRDGGRWAHGST